MKLKTHHFSFEILESNIDHLFSSLYRSSMNIFRMVQDEIHFKGIYDPKTNILVEANNKNEFESFQEILRNLNNFIYFNSLFLGSYSIFEVALIRICEFVEEYSDPQIEFSPPHRSILKNCRIYLRDSKYIDFSEAAIDSIYTYLFQIGEIRNLIAHGNGNIILDKNIALEQQKNYNMVKSMKGLTLLTNGQIYINDEEFINHFIHESHKFIMMQINQLKNNNCN